MRKCFFFYAALCACNFANAQNIDSLFDVGANKSIAEAYRVSGTGFDHNQLEIVAAAYDKLGLLAEEEIVLQKLVGTFPLFLTYTIPSNYMYYASFIKGGLMEKYRKSIVSQYAKSIQDTLLGKTLLYAFYRDQSVRQKFDDNQLKKKIGLKPTWDSIKLMQEWRSIDEANTKLIVGIIKDHNSFPSKKDIGLIGTNALFILMQHLNIEYRNRYDKLLFEAACKGDIAMGDYAMYKTMSMVRMHQIPDSLFQNTLDSLSELKCK